MARRIVLVWVMTVYEISPERMQHYRNLIAGVAVAEHRKDDVIRTIGSLMQSFVDRAWGTDPIQILEQRRLKDSFQAAVLHDNLPVISKTSGNAERIDLGSQSEREGANTQTTKKRGWRHGKTRDHESSDLLPRI
jgi:hypothetical protein